MRNFALLLSEEDKDQGEHMKSCFRRDMAVCFFCFFVRGGGRQVEPVTQELGTGVGANRSTSLLAIDYSSWTSTVHF